MGFVCSSSVSTLKFDDSQLKSDIGPRVSFFMLQLKECGNHVKRVEFICLFMLLEESKCT